MNSIRRFGLLHVLAPIFAALPCLHTTMGETTRTFSLYSLLAQPQALSLRGLAPYILFILCMGAGASFVFRHGCTARLRRIGLVLAWLGLVALIDLGKSAFTFAKLRTLPFLPPIEFHAGLGLWSLLALQLVIVGAAYALPMTVNPSDVSARGAR